VAVRHDLHLISIRQQSANERTHLRVVIGDQHTPPWGVGERSFRDLHVGRVRAMGMAGGNFVVVWIICGGSPWRDGW
jgi:hypothetical protein